MQLQTFKFQGENLAVKYIETVQVKDGVECDVYAFTNDNEKDLGIIRVKAGHTTPLQKVLKGDKTIEGYIAGKGELVITLGDGKKNEYRVENEVDKIEVQVNTGELMQWFAETDLMFYEVCFPPYSDGRFQNL